MSVVDNIVLCPLLLVCRSSYIPAAVIVLPLCPYILFDQTLYPDIYTLFPDFCEMSVFSVFLVLFFVVFLLPDMYSAPCL